MAISEAPRRTSVFSSDLPLQLKPTIGRQHELTTIRARLLRRDVRLITLTGPPGVGKTHLALEVGARIRDEFEAGVRFVDLAPIDDASQVIDAIARALDIREVDRQALVAAVEEFLGESTLLLILDNCEQVLDAAELVGRLLATCRHLKVLATSRAPFHLRWEHELPVPPLRVPALDSCSSSDDVTASEAGQLFIQRAQTVAPDFVLRDADATAVAEICTLLDGLPLALELAAARIKLFPPRALLRRLYRVEESEAGPGSSLRLLTDNARDLPLRQQTLFRAIDWSYDLLDAAGRALFRRLSVFVGGCTLEAAEAVAWDDGIAGLDVVASLVDHSLVTREEQQDGEPRLRMLETIREYALLQLDASDEANLVRTRHTAHYLELVERAAHQLVGPQQQDWFARLERERDNLRAVEQRATIRGDADTVIRLGAALWPFWLARDDASQARARLDAMLALVGTVAPCVALARALHGAGLLSEKLGDYRTCRKLFEQGIGVARQVDDRAALAALLDGLGRQEFIEGHYAEARPLLEESRAIVRASDDRIGLARVLSHLGFLEFLEGRPAVARAIFEEGLALAVAAEDHHRVAEFMDNLGNAAELEGDLAHATRLYERAIVVWRTLGQGHWLAMSLNNLGKVQVRQGQLELARQHLLEALELARRLGNRRRCAYIVSAVAALAAAEGQAEGAARLELVAARTSNRIGAARPSQARRTGSTTTRGAAAADEPSETMTLEQAIDDCLTLLARERPVSVQLPLIRQPARTASAAARRGGREGLTQRERDVVGLLAQGLTNRQVADALVLTEGTAENYVQRILGKLGFSNRVQVAAWAVEQGLGGGRQTPHIV
jgi:predicted ATPase/DNA-binding CsgD family transcriptional regulator